MYTHPQVRAASSPIAAVADLVPQAELAYDQPLELAGMQVLPFRTSHDVEASMGFRFQTADDALGYMTDTGVVTPAAHAALTGVRVLAIESNHDVAMLKEGPYPYVIKQRILSDEGHLSNEQCCAEVASLLHPGLERVVALHISETNNTFGIPKRALQATLAEHGHSATVQVALPHTPVQVG